VNDSRSETIVYTYARVSEDDRKTGSCSLQWQQDTIEAWLKAHDLTENHPFVDNGVSASITLDERPQGRALVHHARITGSLIVVAKFDRIFRDVEDFRARLRVWRDQDVQLVCVQEGLDLTTPTGRMIATMIVAVAEWERETIAGRINAAIATRKEHGLRSSAEPPYGYRHEPTGQMRTDGRVEYRVVENSYEQSNIAKILRHHMDCCSLREIARLMDAANIKTRRGGKWSFTTIADIIREHNPVTRRPRPNEGRPPCPRCGFMSCCCPPEDFQ